MRWTIHDSHVSCFKYNLQYLKQAVLLFKNINLTERYAHETQSHIALYAILRILRLDKYATLFLPITYFMSW